MTPRYFDAIFLQTLQKFLIVLRKCSRSTDTLLQVLFPTILTAKSFTLILRFFIVGIRAKVQIEKLLAYLVSFLFEFPEPICGSGQPSCIYCPSVIDRNMNVNLAAFSIRLDGNNSLMSGSDFLRKFTPYHGGPIQIILAFGIQFFL